MWIYKSIENPITTNFTKKYYSSILEMTFAQDKHEHEPKVKAVRVNHQITQVTKTMYNTEMGDNLGIIIYSSVLLILLHSLRELYMT